MCLAGSVCQTGEMEGTVKQGSWTQREAESGVSHFHLSPSITLKDVGSQHGRIRGFAQEPTVVEVPLDLQEDEIPTSERTKPRRRRACLWERWLYLRTPKLICNLVTLVWKNTGGLQPYKTGELEQQNNKPDKSPRLVSSHSLWVFWIFLFDLAEMRVFVFFGGERRRPRGKSCCWYCASLKAPGLVSDNRYAPKAARLLRDHRWCWLLSSSLALFSF